VRNIAIVNNNGDPKGSPFSYERGVIELQQDGIRDPTIEHHGDDDAREDNADASEECAAA